MNTIGQNDPRSILVLQGGGALGAYECGAFEALLPRLRDLAVVAGTSIGAVNASVIARHYTREDGGKAALTALKSLWVERLANPPWHTPIPLDAVRRLTARMLSLFGHPHLFALRPSCQLPWVLVPGAVWADVGYCDLWPLERTLADPGVFGSYSGHGRSPELIVTAVDIEAGQSRAFDSWRECITPEKVAACGSLPPNFVPKAIKEDGRTFYYWDGGLWNNTPLRDVLNVLQAPDRQSDQYAGEYEIYIVDVFHKQGYPPHNLAEVAQRIYELEYADKTAYEVKVCGLMNNYIDLMAELESYKESLPQAYQQGLEAILRSHVKIGDRPVQDRFRLRITTIQRSNKPPELDELLSSAADFSPERVEELMAQGREDTRKALEA
jgi:NTE family protein